VKSHSEAELELFTNLATFDSLFEFIMTDNVYFHFGEIYMIKSLHNWIEGFVV